MIHNPLAWSNHKAAELAVVDTDTLIVDDMDLHFKSEVKEAQNYEGGSADVIQKTILHEVFWIWWEL